MSQQDDSPIFDADALEEDDNVVDTSVRKMPAPTTDAQANAYQAAIEAEDRLLALLDQAGVAPEAMHVAESELMAAILRYDRLLREGTA